MARKSSKGKEKSTSDVTLERVLADFKASWEYTQSSWHQRWIDNYKLYHNNRVKIGYEGITDTFVPMTFSTIETMTSALFGTKPKFDYLSPKEKPDQKTDILNGLLDFYWDKDQWNIKVINWGRGFLNLGTSIVYLYWENDHPCMINVPLRDFFIDPTATTLENARYMGRRYLTTVEELKTFEVVDYDPASKTYGDMRPKYSNLDNIEEGSKGDPTDKQEKDMFYGSTVPEGKQVECIEYWTNDRCMTILNRSRVIEDCENYYLAKAKYNQKKNKKKSGYAKGLAPFAALRNYVDESLFYAKGETDFIVDQQELLNDITNQNIDSITYALNQMTRISTARADLLNEYENLPGAVYLADEGEIEPIRMGVVPPEAFNERQNIKNEIRETTASNEIIKGVGQETKTTATEVNAQIAGAGQRMGLKVTQIENEGFHRLAKIVFEMIKLYVTEPMMVRIVGKDGARWEEFDPKEFQDEYEPRVQLDVTIENKKREEAEQAKELLAAFLGDPEINQQELKKLVLSRSFDLDPDEVQLLVQPAPMAPPDMGMAAGMPGAMPSAEPPIPMEDQMLGMPEPPPEPIVDEMGNVIDPMSGQVIGILDPETGELIPAGASA